MNFTALLDTAIGLTLVYLGASLFVTILNESIARTFRLRGRALAEHLAQLLDDTGIKQAVTNSNWIARQFNLNTRAGRVMAWIQGYVKGAPNQKIEAYVDPKVVAQVILAKLLPPPAQATAVRLATAAGQAIATGQPTAAGQSPTPMQSVRDAIAALADGTNVKALLWQAAAEANEDINRFVAHVSDWIDKSLNMLGEGYKKWSQFLSFLLGFIIAVSGNLDTVELTRRLYTDKQLRESVAASAEQFTKSANPDVFNKCSALPLDQLKKEPSCAPVLSLVEGVTRRNETLDKLPIGWVDAKLPWAGAGKPCWGCMGLRGLGWLLTALALSLGAPFWFDLLNRFVNIRGEVRKPDDDKAK